MTVQRRKRGKAVLRCPQCFSDRLVFASAMITGQVYHCLACDYQGSFVIETDGPAEGSSPTSSSDRPGRGP